MQDDISIPAAGRLSGKVAQSNIVPRQQRITKFVGLSADDFRYKGMVEACMMDAGEGQQSSILALPNLCKQAAMKGQT
jgi:hypothetical protein